MASKKVTTYLKEHRLENRILIFEESCATVDLAAKAAGVEPGQVAKSLTFWLGNNPIMVVMAGDRKVDNERYKARFGRRPRMLSCDEVSEVFGYSVGEVCPFVIKEGIPVYLDISLRRYNTLYPAAGSANSLVALSLEELEILSKRTDWVDVSKNS